LIATPQTGLVYLEDAVALPDQPAGDPFSVLLDPHEEPGAVDGAGEGQALKEGVVAVSLAYHRHVVVGMEPVQVAGLA
jgi:hypothetical protein